MPETFSAVLEDVGLLRDSLATISELLDETELHIKEKGIEMISADRAVVVVVDFMLSRNAFKEYNHQSDMKIGVNLISLLSVLRRARPQDKLRIKVEDNKLFLTLESDSTRSFVLPLIGVSREESPPVDKLDFSASIKINSDVLGSGIEDAELIADSVVFTVRKDAFVMKSESDSSSTQLMLPTGTEGLNIINVNEPVRARYSVDYLKKIIKAKKVAEMASVHMSTDYPMRISFDVPGKITLGFILAPRIEE